MARTPTPFRTLLAVVRGTLPRLIQGRGWTLATITVVPVALITTVALLPHHGFAPPPTLGLTIFHQAFVPFLLPILSLVAAPAGIREDLEQRTLPFLLVRPACVSILPFARALPWVFWGTLWLMLATLSFLTFDTSLETLLRLDLALVSAFWAQMALMSFLVLRFKRGVIWGVVYFFAIDPLVRIFPSNLQRITSLHYLESIAGSRGGGVRAHQILVQEQVTTEPWIAVLVLLAFGALCWVLAGMHLQRRPVGLAGQEGEG